jgi:hypothetical protein
MSDSARPNETAFRVWLATHSEPAPTTAQYRAFRTWGVAAIPWVGGDPVALAWLRAKLLAAWRGPPDARARATIKALVADGRIGDRQLKVFYDTRGRLIFFSDTDAQALSPDEKAQFSAFHYVALPRIDNRAHRMPVMRKFHIGVRFEPAPTAVAAPATAPTAPSPATLSGHSSSRSSRALAVPTASRRRHKSTRPATATAATAAPARPPVSRRSSLVPRARHSGDRDRAAQPVHRRA